MPRKQAKGSKSEEQPVDESALAFSGSIRTADEGEGLDVVISKSGRYVVMRAGSAQLGRWPLADVTIGKIDDESFVFIAEDDELVFTPSDPSALAASGLIAQEQEEVKSRRLKRRSTKKTPDDPKSRRLKRRSTKKTPDDPKSDPPKEEPDSSDDSGRGFRLRILDAARRNDLFNLERVPIDESLRGSEHEHSWEHRVATDTGLASRVCTICGKIRLSKSS
jgi:hypothetical protein